MKLTWDEFKVVTDFARYMASFTIFAFDFHFPVSFELFDDGKYARMTFGRNTDGLTDRIAFDLFFVPDEKRLRPKAVQRRRDFTIGEIKAAASPVYGVQSRVRNAEVNVGQAIEFTLNLRRLVSETRWPLKKMELAAQFRHAVNDALVEAESSLGIAGERAAHDKGAIEVETAAFADVVIDSWSTASAIEDGIYYDNAEWRGLTDLLVNALTKAKQKIGRLFDDIAWPGIGPLGELFLGARLERDETKRAAFVEWAIEHGYLWPQSEGVTPEGVAYSADTGEELVWSTRVPRYASRVEAYPASARIAERYELRANPSVVVTMPLGAWLAMGWWMQRQPVPPKGPSNDMNVLDEPPSFSVGDAEYVGPPPHRMNPWYFIERVGVRTPSSWRPVLTHEGYTIYL